MPQTISTITIAFARQCARMLAVMIMESQSVCLGMISVGNLEHYPSYRGNSIPMMPSKIELFPAD
jgi:hypothetical protein